MTKVALQAGEIPCSSDVVYRLCQNALGVQEPLKIFDVFKIDQRTKTYSKSVPIMREVVQAKFYENEPVQVIICESGSKTFMTIERIVPSMNITPELLLGSITLGIGAVGTAVLVITNAGIGAISMTGFIIAGLATIIGARFLKKRVERS